MSTALTWMELIESSFVFQRSDFSGRLGGHGQGLDDMLITTGLVHGPHCHV